MDTSTDVDTSQKVCVLASAEFVGVVRHSCSNPGVGHSTNPHQSHGHVGSGRGSWQTLQRSTSSFSGSRVIGFRWRVSNFMSHFLVTYRPIMR